MKIGIVTYHFAHNFGANLQCCCLQEFLKNHGFDVEIINYCPSGLTRYYTVFSNPATAIRYKYVMLRNRGMSKTAAGIRAPLTLKRVVTDSARFRFRLKRKQAFDDFAKKYYNLTDKYYTFEELQKNCGGYDALICGSDQIWNVKLLNDTFDEAYFLKFAQSGQIKIAYAPSFGETDPRLYPEALSDLLSGFRTVSVREQQDIIKLEAVLNRKVYNVIDPVFLARAADLKRLTESTKPEPEPYVLIYALKNDNKFFELARNKYSDFKIIDVSPISISWDSSVLKKERRNAVGPDEFLALINNSFCVLTNSFHGTSFSIILHKNFYVFPLVSRNERLKNILSIANLESRFVYSADDADEDNIDYEKVDKLIDAARFESEKLLLGSLDGTHIEEKYEPVSEFSELSVLRQGDECCGCGACISVCRHGAISLVPDDEGFLVPEIDSNKCVHCNMCVKACNMSHDRTKDEGAKKIFAFQNNPDIRKQSASGGAWSAIASVCFEQNGAAVGAVWSDDYLTVVHNIAFNKEECAPQSGSKYIEGCAVGIFDNIRLLLNDGRKVVFSGMPCQCSALKTYLNMNRIDRSNLILVDLICHGKSSPAVWGSYVRYIEDFYHGKIAYFTFRDKTQSWSGIHEKIEFEDGRKLRLTPELHSIGKIMETEAMLRPSCYNCPFAKLTRIGDVTIGDFWGIEKEFPSWDNRLGTSVVFANTDAGIRFLSKALKGNYTIQETPELKVVQPNLRMPTQRPGDREIFWDRYRRVDEKEFIAGFSCLKSKEKIKMKLKSFLHGNK